jgi:protein-S-isoprenylcysteine O-methyltransferase Ste14
MSLSWCMACGFDSVIPYFYCIYFAILLIHRAQRDDEACSKKYGKDWEKYKRSVPAKFIPYLF